MKKNRFLFVAMLFAALSLGFVSCDDNKGNEPDDPATEQGGSTENNGGEETPTPEEPVTFTLTLLSSNEAIGIVTEGGTYNKDAEVIIEATATKEACVFVKWSDGNTENPRTLTMTENLTLTAEFDYAYVDLGLSVKWATCNVGATKPEEYGNYYAWGETSPKSSYNSSNYTYSSSPTTLPLNRDAVAVNWGGNWRMPTLNEIKELKEKCKWTWTVRGYTVTGPNGNSIFLPAAGYRNYSDLHDAGSYGYYWSSSLYAGNSGYAYYLFFLSDYVYLDYRSRYYGRSVRGVIE